MFNLTKSYDNVPVVYMRLPLIRSWNYTFNYNYKWLGIVHIGQMKITAVGVEALCAVEFLATDKGYLYPQLHELSVDFGRSEIYDDGNFRQFWYRQLFHITKYIV